MGAGDTEALAKLLVTTDDRTIAESDPYRQFSEVPQLLGQAAMAGQKFKTRDRIIAGLLAGAGTGILNNLGDSYQDKQKELYTQALLQQAAGVDAPVEGINPNVFKSAQKQASIFKTLQGAQAVEEAKAMKLEKQKMLDSALIKEGYIKDNTGNYVKLDMLDPLTKARKMEEMKADIKNKTDIATPENEKLLKLMSSGDKEKVGAAVGITRSIDKARRELSEFKDMGRIEYALKKGFAATDIGKVQSQFALIAKQITRAIEGGRPSNFDAETYDKIVNGDYSVNISDVLALSENVRNHVSNSTNGMMDGYRALMSGTVTDALKEKISPEEMAAAKQKQRAENLRIMMESIK